MKTAVLLSAASLATAFLIPGNDQQLLAAFTDDSAGAIDAAAGQRLQSAEKPPHDGEKHHKNHGHHDDDSEHQVNMYFDGDDDDHDNIPGKWQHVSSLAEGLQKFVAHFEEFEPSERHPEHGMHGKKGGKKGKHGRKHFEDEECEEMHKRKKYGDKHEPKEKHHEEDREHHEGKKEKHGKKGEKKHGGKKKHENEMHHHGGEYDVLDVFDLQPCGHHKKGHFPGFFNKIMGGLKHVFGYSACDSDERPPRPPHHHYETNKTIYELISSSNHTRIFTRIIDQYDEVVEKLNATTANYTIFVPVDKAFDDVHHHIFSKEAVFNWLEYHISPEVLTLHDFFDVQTLPTLRSEETEGGDPQRISTSITPKGLTLNFNSHVIRPDIHATNGIIHAIDKLLIPALSAKTIIELVPSVFSTLDLALIKAGFFEHGPKELKAGGTFLAPTNQAFAKLPIEVNAFLFSPAGKKYLKALLKYHVVPGHILFTDAYYEPKSDDEAEDAILDKQHYDFPTLLNSRPVSIDIHQFHRLTLMTINKHVPVSVNNVPVREGVIHLLSSVLIPPHPELATSAAVEEGEEHEHEHDHHELSVHELMTRLEPFLE